MNDRRSSKLKQYIAEDRPQRFRSYCRKHELQLSEMVLRHNQNLLHYWCKHGSSTAMLRYLLQKGVSPCHVDSHQNTPLHIALKRALEVEREGRHQKASTLYSEMILPLIETAPQTLGLQNGEGVTGRDLLNRLVVLRSLSQAEVVESSESDVSEEEERQWRDKLQEELHHEYHTEWGHYEEGFSNIYDERETYDDWADRIQQQYYEKKHAGRHAHICTAHQQRKKRRSDKDGDKATAGDRFSQRREEMKKQAEMQRSENRNLRLLKLRMQYEKRYRELLDKEDKGTLRYGDIPWPSADGVDTDLAVLTDRLDLSDTENRKYLRDQRVRWHPDKFLQRFGQFLLDSDRERIQKRVTQIAQSLNKLMKELPT